MLTAPRDTGRGAGLPTVVAVPNGYRPRVLLPPPPEEIGENRRFPVVNTLYRRDVHTDVGDDNYNRWPAINTWSAANEDDARKICDGEKRVKYARPSND